MKKMALLVALLLLAATPLALAEEYWTVVYEDGDPRDVINAANFAASMKGSAAVTFTGKTEVQAREELISTRDVLAVVFSGREVLILEGSNIPQNVIENVQVYLARQDFALSYGRPSDLLEGEDVEENAPELPEPDPVEEPNPVEAPDPVNVSEPSQEPQEPQEESPPQELPEQEREDRQAKGPSILVRVWRWFSGIFS